MLFTTREEQRKKYVRRIAVGSTIAAAAGYMAGVLTAPKSGRETRKDIKNASIKGFKQAEKELKVLNTELDKVIKEAKALSAKAGTRAKKEIDAALVKANDSKEKAREMISAIHEGDAEDKDLQRAIKNASTSLKALKKYLKK
jgi:gas vesicle protein